MFGTPSSFVRTVLVFAGLAAICVCTADGQTNDSDRTKILDAYSRFADGYARIPDNFLDYSIKQPPPDMSRLAAMDDRIVRAEQIHQHAMLLAAIAWKQEISAMVPPAQSEALMREAMAAERAGDTRTRNRLM